MESWAIIMSLIVIWLLVSIFIKYIWKCSILMAFIYSLTIILCLFLSCGKVKRWHENRKKEQQDPIL